MTKPRKSPAEKVRLRGWKAFSGRGLKVRAGFCAADGEVLAGGPVELEFFVKNLGSTVLHVALATDRVRLRPDFFSFSGDIAGTGLNKRGPKAAAGSRIQLIDPVEQFGYLGGPGGLMKVAPGETFSHRLLVNDFLNLETAQTKLKRGETGVLTVRCRRPLPLATTMRSAYKMGPDAPVADVTLRLTIRREDRALGRLIEKLAGDIRSRWPTFAAPEFERAISILSALRITEAVPALRMLGGHPDGGTRWRAMRALAIIEERTDGAQGASR